jgi:nucleoside 2-deoxyribosyltransferase
MKTNKRQYVYLAGNISDDPETYKWRYRFEQEILKRSLRVAVLNPCANKFNKGIEPDGKGSDSVNFFDRAIAQRGKGVLALKDYQMIKICTIIVANLKLIDPEKPMIGTVVELTWAYDLKIPVIGIVDESFAWGQLYSRHPFLDRFISERVSDEIEAVDIIQDFFIFL